MSVCLPVDIKNHMSKLDEIFCMFYLWLVLVRMERRLAGWSVRLPVLIFPCTTKSGSSLLVLAQPDGSRYRAVKPLCVCLPVAVARSSSDNNAIRYVLPVL